VKELIGVILQIILLLVAVGIAFLLLYLGFRSPRQNKMNNIDQTELETHHKFIGKT